MVPKVLRRRVFAVVAVVFPLVLFLAFRNGLVSKAEQPAALLLPAVTASKTDALFTDADGDGVADPGDTLEYTVTITNGAAAGAGNDATGMTFTDTLEANLTLVAGSVNASPIAGNDSYETVGNTQLQVGAAQTVTPSIFVSGSVLSNDIDPGGAAPTAVALVNAATANGGTVTLQTNGTFVYTPPANFTGTDSFTYQATDGTLTGTGTVSVNVLGMVRYVKNDAPAGGDGRSHLPFNTLAAAQTATAGVTIYVFAGNGTTSGQAAGITLAGNQRLIGAGVALVMPGITVNGVSNPQILAAGSQPQITNTNAGGNGVSIGTSTGVEIQGLNIGGNTNAIDATFTGAGTGSILIAGNTVSSAGAEGIDINGGGTGTLNVAINNTSVNSTGTGIDVTRTAGTVRITGFSNNSISGNTGGSGFVVNTVIFDADALTAGFQTVNAGALAIGQTGNGVGALGMNLAGALGDLNFTDLDIYADNGSALFVQSTGAFSAGAATGFRIVTTANAATLVSTNGAAADITSATIDLQLGALTSTNSTTEGVELDSVAGTFSAPAGSSITNATNADFLMENGGTANVTYHGTITDDAGALVTISGQTGGTKSFTGAITDNFDGDGSEQGITLTGNSGATISFSGGLSVRTTTNAALTATGGGTVNICDENPCDPATTGALVNRLQTTTGTALNVANTSIGANNLEFRSISANGAANGIILNTTGAGGLAVKGTGMTDGSGGTIQNISARGVSATSTANLSLKNMAFTNANTVDADPCTASDNSLCNAAIYLNTVTGATLDNVDINGTAQNGINVREVSNLQILNSTITNTGASPNPADDTEEGGLYALNLFGTSSISNSVFSFPRVRGAVIYNTSKTLNLTVSNSQFNDTQTSPVGADGFELSSFGTSNTTLNIANCTFLRDKTNAAQIIGENTSTTNVNITGSSVDPQAGVGVGFEVAGNGTAVMNFNVNDNPSVKGRGTSIINIFAQGNSTLQGHVNRNTVSSLGGSGSGIRAVASADGDVKIEIDGNTVSNIALDNGITATAVNGTGRMDATITDNNVSVINTAAYNIQVAAGASSSTFTNVACANVAGNTVSPSPITGTMVGNYQGRAATPSHTLLVQGAGPNIPSNWNARGNLPASPTSSVFQTGTGTFTFNQTCLLPTNPEFFAGAALLAQTPQTPPKSGALPDLLNFAKQTPAQTLATLEPFVKPSVKPEMVSGAASATVSEEWLATENGESEPARASYPEIAEAFLAEIYEKAREAISPTVAAQGRKEIPVGIAGETITVGSPGGFTLPAGNKQVVIKFRAVIGNVPGLVQVSNQGTVSGTNFADVLTDDPDAAGGANPTVTLLDRTLVSITSSQNPSVAGQPVAFTATLTGTPAHAAGNPSGTVQFFDNGNPLGAPVNAVAGAVNTATASLAVGNLSAGNHTITAQYSGGGQFNSGAGSLTGNPQVVSNTAVWDGSADANWNTAANWTTNFAPTSTNDVSIPAAGVTNNPTISATDISVNSITEAAGRTLTINAGRTLTVTGACTINGTMTVAGAFTCGTFTGTGTVNFTGGAAQNVPALAYQNLTVNNAAGVNLAGDATVGGVLTLTSGNVNTGANTLILGGTATVTRTSGHVIGNLRKTFNGAGSFQFPVGTANGYSPATVNVTAGAFPLAFNVRAVQGAQPALVAANSLQRYWQVSPTGGSPTANLRFDYLQTDVSGTETSYRIVRVNGGQIVSYANNPPNVVIDATNNFATINAVTAFSDWTLGALVPTAAGVAVAGRVVTADGRGVYNAEVVMTGSDGQTRTARTNPFGYYRLTDVPAGATYTIEARHKRYAFVPRVVTVEDAIGDLDLVALEK